jgi:hypothetical protein
MMCPLVLHDNEKNLASFINLLHLETNQLECIADISQIYHLSAVYI